MIRLLRYALSWLFVPLLLTRWAIARFSRKPSILLVNLEGSHPHRPTGGLLDRARPVLTRRALRRALREAARDRRVQTVQVRIGPLAGGHATLYELREALRQGREAGLTIEAWLAWADTRTLWVASAASRVPTCTRSPPRSAVRK